MEVLIEDYDVHQPVIDLMFPVIERYEEVEQFSEFNQAIEKTRARDRHAKSYYRAASIDVK